MNPMKFIKTKCKVPHQGKGNPKHEYRLSGEWFESSSEEVLGVVVDKKLNTSWQCSLAAQQDDHNLGCIRRSVGQQVEGGDSAPVLCSSEILPGILLSSLWPLAQEGHGIIRMNPEAGHKDGQVCHDFL